MSRPYRVLYPEPTRCQHLGAHTQLYLIGSPLYSFFSILRAGALTLRRSQGRPPLKKKHAFPSKGGRPLLLGGRPLLQDLHLDFLEVSTVLEEEGEGPYRLAGRQGRDSGEENCCVIF